MSISGPEKVDDNLPSYPGFEKDVFRVVKDYFCGLTEPLMTFEMYEVIINVFGKIFFKLCLYNKFCKTYYIPVTVGDVEEKVHCSCSNI